MVRFIARRAAPIGGSLLCVCLAACAGARLPVVARALTAPESAELVACRDSGKLRPNASNRCGDLDAIERAHAQQLADEQAARDAEAAYQASIRAALARADAAAAAGRHMQALHLYMDAMALTRPRGKEDLAVRERVSDLAATMSQLPPIPEEAERHAVRAQARLEMEGADYEAAAAEMTSAIRLAPWWADGYYNLGLMAAAAEQHVPAINNLKIYLKMNPGSPDAGAIQAKIYQLELAAEEAAFTQGLAGTWISSAQDAFQVEPDGAGKFRIRSGIYEFSLAKKGKELEGTAAIASRRWDYCDIPGEQSAATGRISADGSAIELHTQISSYSTDKRWVGISMGMYECTSVVFLQKSDVVFALTRSPGEASLAR